MSQNEVYDILKNKRLMNDDNYFSQSKISKLVIDGHLVGKYVGSCDNEVIKRDCKRLLKVGILEACKKDNELCFRVRKKVLEE